MSREVINLKELCAYLKLTEKEVMRRIHADGLPSHKVGGVLRFRRIEVDDWLQRNMKDLSGDHLHKLEHGHKDDQEPPGGRLLVTPMVREVAISINLGARTKPSLLRELTKLGEPTGLIYDLDGLAEALRDRESLCSTALEDGVAIPHPRIRHDWMLAETFLVVAIIPSGIPFGAPDGGLTDLFFMPLCQSDQEHLQVLARLCRMLQSDSFLLNLRSAESAAEIVELIKERESDVVRDWLKTK